MDKIKALLTRRVWKFPIIAWVALLVVAITLVACVGSKFNASDSEAQYNSAEISQASDSSSDAAEQTWGQRFTETEPAVIDFLKTLFSPYEIRQIEDELMLTLDYTPTEPDIYYADIDLILSSADTTGIKSVIEYVEDYMNQNSPYHIGFRIMFMKNENEGICIASFGAGFDGYAFSSGEAGRSEYSTLAEVPDDLFGASDSALELADASKGSAVKTESRSDAPSVNALCSLIEITVSQNFKHYSITSKDNIITLNVWQEGIAAEVMMLHSQGADESNKSWMALKNGMTKMSRSICGLIRTAGRDDVVFNLNMLNDMNTDNVLLSMCNTVIFYDALAQQ